MVLVPRLAGGSESCGGFPAERDFWAPGYQDPKVTNTARLVAIWGGDRKDVRLPEADADWPGAVTCMDWVGRGRYVVTGNSTGKVILRDARSGRIMRSWEAHAGAVEGGIEHPRRRRSHCVRRTGYGRCGMAYTVEKVGCQVEKADQRSRGGVANQHAGCFAPRAKVSSRIVVHRNNPVDAYSRWSPPPARRSRCSHGCLRFFRRSHVRPVGGL